MLYCIMEMDTRELPEGGSFCVGKSITCGQGAGCRDDYGVMDCERLRSRCRKSCKA
nr:MAG TPA: hypothetical protein [Caudoviricetes sp.]